MPPLLLPPKGRYGLRDYEKMFCPDLKGGHDIFAMRGIDRDKGCMVVVRPDQYVAHVLPLDGHAALAAYFDGFMLRRIEHRGRLRHAFGDVRAGSSPNPPIFAAKSNVTGMARLH